MLARKPQVASIAIVVAATVLPNAWPQVVTQESVEDIWIHQVPGPPQGDFWDPVVANLFNVLANPASIYPDVVACGSSASGRRACTSVCQDVQGEGCRGALELTLPPGDPRLQLRLVEIDPNRQREVVTVPVNDPGQCSHTTPCTFATPMGPLVVSFGTVLTGTSGAVAPPAPPRPQVSTQGSAANIKRARTFVACTAAKAAARNSPCGPYKSEEEAMWAALDMAHLGTKCSADINNEVEFAGYIYAFSDTNGKEQFSFLGPYSGTATVSDFSKPHAELLAVNAILKAVTQVATYHSHPSQIPTWLGKEAGSGRFSVADLRSHAEANLNAYVVGADGGMRKFTPNGRKFPWMCSPSLVPALCETWYDNNDFTQGKIEHLGTLGPNTGASCQ